MKSLKHILILFTVVCGIHTSIFAQLPEYTTQISAAYTKSTQVASFSMHKDLINPLDQKIRLGLGIRLNGFIGTNVNYLTGDYELAKKDPNMDTFTIESPSTFSASLFFNGEYQFRPKIRFGFNMDLLGYSFGPEQSGAFGPANNAKNQGKIAYANTEAIPLDKNVQKFANRDFGSLNTQLFVKYIINNKWHIYGGMTYYISEYSSRLELGVDNNTRFRNKSFMPFIGVAINKFD